MNAARMRWRRRSMSAARMMTTMTRPMRNMALASLDDPPGAGRRAAADPWCLLLTLHPKSLTRNFILECEYDVWTEDRSLGGSHRRAGPGGRPADGPARGPRRG